MPENSSPLKKRQPGSAGAPLEEQELIKRLATLPIPIRLVRHMPEAGSYWYRWQALSGSGDRGTFEDALIEALAHVQRVGNLEVSHGSLIASPGRHTRTRVVTLREALRQLQQAKRRVRATEAMYLLIGAASSQEWVTGEQALEVVLSQQHSGDIYAAWEGYIENDQTGPDPAGIYLFFSSHAYRAFDTEPESVALASSSLVMLARRLWSVTKRDYPADADTIQRRHAPTIAMLFHQDEVAESALHHLMLDCMEVLEKNPQQDDFFA